MSTSYSISESSTFSITDARKLGVKVATDLARMRKFYKEPSEYMITLFEEEIVCFLKAGYLDEVTYGFQRNGKWIYPTLKYTAANLAGGSASDDDPGRIQPGWNVDGAEFHSFLTYNSAFWSLPFEQRQAFKQTLPTQRTEGSEPGVNGYFERDLTYSAGGRALNRAKIRSL